MADGGLVGVEASGWDAFGDAVGGDLEGPLVAVAVLVGFDESVVVVTEQSQVGQVRGSPGPPGGQVMRLARGRMGVTPGEHASAVPVAERGPQGPGDEPVAPADVEDF